MRVQPRSRLPIIKEIIETEHVYQRHLEDIATVCIPVLEKLKCFTVKDSVNIFLNIVEILNISREFLGGLEAAANSDGCVGDVYTNFAPKFKSYAEYCTNYPVAIRCWEKKIKAHKSLRAAASKCAERCGGLQLPSLLIMPIQRIPRYKLLLEDIVKHTPSWHPDLNLCKAALGEIKNVATYTNEFVRENQDGLEALIDLESSISGLTKEAKCLFDGRLPILKEGALVKRNHKGKQEQLHFALFKRHIIYMQAAGMLRKKRYAFRGLDIIIDLVDENPSSLSFTVVAQPKTLHLTALSASEKALWIEAIQRSINRESFKKKAKLRSVESAQAVVQNGSRPKSAPSKQRGKQPPTLPPIRPVSFPHPNSNEPANGHGDSIAKVLSNHGRNIFEAALSGKPVPKIVMGDDPKVCFQRSELVIMKQTNSFAEGVDQMHLEMHLSANEFFELFKMSREIYKNLPKWKMLRLKKEAGLF